MRTSGGRTIGAALNLFARLPLHPLLLAVYPILYLYSVNLHEVLPVDAVEPLIWSLAAVIVLYAVLALLLRSAARAAIVTSTLVVAWYFFGHLQPAFRDAGLNENVELATWAGLATLSLLVAVRGGRQISQLNLAASVVALVLVTLTAGAIIQYEAGRAGPAPAVAARSPTLPSAARRPERDIFYLVFDRYGSDWSMKQRWGVEPELSGWLTDRGFQVVPGARANYRATDLSLTSTLNLGYLDELTDRYGRATGDRTPARQMLADHLLGHFLKANGYRYVHISSWYDPTLDSPIADEVLQFESVSEFMQVLHDTSMAPLFDQFVEHGSGERPPFTRHRESARFQFRQILRQAGAPGRRFVFAHVLLPHPPYVFHPDGSDLLGDDSLAMPEEARLRQQLPYTNARIRQVVETLLSRPPAEQPIIIIQADEGPFLCGNADCIDGSPETYGIRFGVLGAYYLPGLDIELAADHSSVNTFRTVLREYFGADLPDLPNRSFDWPDNDHIYDFFDITDQLPLPGG
jgi:hypothetical protein